MFLNKQKIIKHDCKENFVKGVSSDTFDTVQKLESFLDVTNNDDVSLAWYGTSENDIANIKDECKGCFEKTTKEIGSKLRLDFMAAKV